MAPFLTTACSMWLKARMGEWYYTWAAVKTFNQRYLIRPLRLRAQIGSERVDGVTAIVQNAHPYTYFGDRPVRMAEGAALDSGDLAGIVLRRANPLDVPSIGWRALSGRSHVVGHRHVHGYRGVSEVRVTSLDDRFNTSRYLAPTSDIVALMTLEHQTRMNNLMTRIGWDARIALREGHGKLEPAAEEKINPEIEEMLGYMLFVDEAPLKEPVKGVSTFTQTFAERGPRDSRRAG